MLKFILLGCALTANLSGCVLGYGRCLFMDPVKVEFTGKIHFREFARDQRIDHVPVLSLDKTAYVYAPSLSKQCSSVQDLQLIPFADLPDSIGENSRVIVAGSLAQSTQDHQHTPFVFNLRAIRLAKAP